MARKGKAPPRREVTKRRLARWQRERRRRRILVSSVALIVVIVIGIVVYGVYATSVAPGRAWLSTVNGTIRTVSFTGDDYLRVAKVLGISALTVKDHPLLMLEQYELMSQGAEELEIEVSAEEVTEEIKSFLFPDDEEVSQDEFEQAYQQMLSSRGISDEDFRWLMEYKLLGEKLDEYLREQVPQQAFQVHVQGILVATAEDAQTVLERLDGGEDFAALAQELSTDVLSGLEGGDLGWLAEGIMSEEFDEVAFNPDIELGEVCPPILTLYGYWVIKVLEREENRPLDEDVRGQLQNKEFNRWLDEEREKKVVRNPNLDLDRIYQWAVEKAG